VPFGKLGKQLRLPQTATLALRAPQQIPFLHEEAYQWYPSFDQLGDIIERPNPAGAVTLLSTVLDHLMSVCTWPAQNIHLFGFAQGGSVALESIVTRWKAEAQKSSISRVEDSPNDSTPLSKTSFGSIVSVGGPLLLHHALSTACPTPVLLFHRTPTSEISIPAGELASLRKCFSAVKEIKAPGDGMPRSREEWHPIMEFWSQRLSRRPVEGLYKVMSGTNS